MKCSHDYIERTSRGHWLCSICGYVKYEKNIKVRKKAIDVYKKLKKKKKHTVNKNNGITPLITEKTDG